MSDNTKSVLESAVAPLARPDDSAYANDVRLVHTTAELQNAFAELTAGAGGIIELAGGVSPFSLRASDYHDLSEDAPVLIRSADPDNRAQLTSIKLNDRENIAIENVEIYATREMIGDHASMISIYGSENIAIYGSEIHSDASGAAGLFDLPGADLTVGSSAMIFRGSKGFIFSDNLIHNVNHALTFIDSNDITVLHNEVTQIQGDGMRLAGVQNVEIAANWQHDFLGSTHKVNHSDMLQFWGSNIKQNTVDVHIASNVFDVGDGPSYQMIFGHNEDFETNGWLFDNIIVENNVIVGGTYHRISVSDTQNMIIRNNTIISKDDGYSIQSDGSKTSHGEGWVKIGGVNGTIDGNIAIQIPSDDGTNALLTSGNGEGSKDQVLHYMNLEAGFSGDLRDLQLRPDSDLDGKFGSSLLWSTPQTETLVAVADVEVSRFDKSVVNLDAGFSSHKDGYVGAGDAVFQWTFADGSVKRGLSVEHDFGKGGTHDYTLKVSHADGSVDEITRTISIDNAVQFDFVVENGTVVNAAGGANFSNAGDLDIVGDAIRLTDGKVPEIGRFNDGLFSNSAFNIEMTIDPASAKGGVFLMAHMGMAGSVSDDGSVKFEFATEDGWFSARTEAGMFDEGPRHFNFVFDGENETFSIYADGELMIDTDATGMTLPAQNWSLTFGRVWGGTIDAEISNIRFAQESLSAEEVHSRYLEVTGQAPVIEPVEAIDPPAPVEPIEPFDAGETLMEVNFQEDLPSGMKIVGESDVAGAINIGEQKLMLDRSVDWIYEASSFDIGFEATLNDADSDGHILHLYKTLDLKLNDDGSLSFNLTTDEGSNVITTETGLLSDGQAHAVNVGYDAKAEVMQILIDGKVVAEGELGGTTPPVKYWGLTFGHTWGGERPDMTIDNIKVAEFTDVRRLTDTTEASDAAIDQTLLIDIDFDGDVTNAIASDAEPVVSRGDVAIHEVDGASVGVFDGGDCVSISRDTDFLYERDEFEFDIRMATDKGDYQTVLNLHKSMSGKIHNNEFVFEMETDEGSFSVRTEAAVITDGEMHSIEIGYSDAKGALALRIDGEIVDIVEASGTTLSRKYWGLDIGTPWRGDLEAEIDHFQMAESADWAFAI